MLGALVAWLTRPSFAGIDERAAQLAESSNVPGKDRGKEAGDLAGDLVCVLDPERMCPDIAERPDGELSILAEIGVDQDLRAIAH